MNRSVQMTITLVSAAILAAGAAAELPLSDPLWNWMRPAATLGGVPLSSIMPLCGLPAAGSGAWAPLLDRAGRLGGEGRHSLAEGDWIGIDGRVVLEGAEDDGGQYRVGTALRLVADLTDNLSVHERMSVWAGGDERPPHHFSRYHIGEEEGRHLYADWGYIAYTPGTIGLSVGRIPQTWGPGRYNNLLLSSNSPGLDMMQFSTSPAEWLAFTGLTASVNTDSASYLSMHRLDIRPAASLRIGLSEAILYCSDGLELAYMNPFIPYYPVQWNERDDDNAFLCFDAEWSPTPGLSVYGELLVDDFQYQTTYDRPNKLAWTVGAETATPPGGAWANLEYTRIDRYVYSQLLSRNYYLHDGRIIGSPLGPDTDCLTLGAGWAGLWPLAARTTLDHIRNGEGDIYDGWPDTVTSGEPFPSGTVEHLTRAGLHLSAYPAGSMELHGGISHDWIRNAGHQQGAEDSQTKAWAQAVWNW